MDIQQIQQLLGPNSTNSWHMLGTPYGEEQRNALSLLRRTTHAPGPAFDFTVKLFPNTQRTEVASSLHRFETGHPTHYKTADPDRS
jgi:DNA-binding transcriptional regulator PaaX